MAPASMSLMWNMTASNSSIEGKRDLKHFKQSEKSSLNHPFNFHKAKIFYGLLLSKLIDWSIIFHSLLFSICLCLIDYKIQCQQKKIVTHSFFNFRKVSGYYRNIIKFEQL
jgi:hypothetical protein